METSMVFLSSREGLIEPAMASFPVLYLLLLEILRPNLCFWLFSHSRRKKTSEDLCPKLRFLEYPWTEKERGSVSELRVL